MKCSGKKQPYPSEIESLNKKKREKMFIDVIDQAEMNKKNLTVLDEKIHSEAKNLTNAIETEIGNVEKSIWNQNVNFTETINRVEKQSMTHFTGLSSQIGTQSTLIKVRPSDFILLSVDISESSRIELLKACKNCKTNLNL